MLRRAICANAVANTNVVIALLNHHQAAEAAEVEAAEVVTRRLVIIPVCNYGPAPPTEVLQRVYAFPNRWVLPERS